MKCGVSSDSHHHHIIMANAKKVRGKEITIKNKVIANRSNTAFQLHKKVFGSNCGQRSKLNPVTME